MAKKDAPENLKTRPDLADDREWLVWLRLQPENRGIDVDGLYRSMLDWCSRKGATPTRRRLLNWINSERDNVPMTHQPAYSSVSSPTAPIADPKPEPPCEYCGKQYCLLLHREERGL